MKVTALIPDQIILDVKQRTKSKTITGALTIALEDWLTTQKLQALNKKLEKSPLQFRQGVNAEKIRNLNRE